MASYTIKSGDTLSRIAQQYGTTVSALQASNPTITDPNKIYAGQTLNIGTTTPAVGNVSTVANTMPTTATNTAGNQALLDELKRQLELKQSQLSQAQTLGYTPTQNLNIDPNTSQVLAPTSGTSDTSDYRKVLQDLITQQQTATKSYQDYLVGLPSATEQYETYKTKLGLPAKEQAVTSAQQQLTGIQGQVQDTENLLADLEKNIASRVGTYTSGTGMGLSQAQIARQQATEQKPLMSQLNELLRGQDVAQRGVTSAQTEASSARQQLIDMLNLASQDRTTQMEQAKIPLAQLESLAPLYQSLAEYQSPQEQLAQTIAQEQALKEAGLGSYAGGPDVIGTANTGFYQWNPDTKNYEQIVAPAPASSSGLTPNQQFNAAMDLSKFVATQTKQSQEIIRNANGINALWNDHLAGSEGLQSLNAISQAIITSYGKILDPGSVVRESEYARTPEGLSLVNKTVGWIEKMKRGGAGLTEGDLQEFVNAVNTLTTEAKKQVDAETQRAVEFGQRTGVDTTFIGGGYYSQPSTGGASNVKSVVEVPDNIAQGIQENLDAGNTLEEIRQGLASQFGRELGYGYLDKYMSAQ